MIGPLKNVLLVVCLIHAMCSFAQEWDIMVVDDGARPSMTIDASGVIHLVFLNTRNTQLAYATIDNGSVFSEVVAESGSFSGPAGIGLDRTGMVDIVIHDHRTENEVFFEFINGEWLGEQLVSNNHDGWDNSVAYDRRGNVHTASSDFVDGIEYAYRDENGVWIKEALPSGPVFYNGSTSIVVDNNDVPHIAYYNSDTGLLDYAVKENGQWIIETIEEKGKYADMVMDRNGLMRVCYLQQLEGPLYAVKVATQSNNQWIIETVDTLRNLGNAPKRVTAIQVDSNGATHISYGDRDAVKYARQVGNEWDINIVIDMATSGVGIESLTDLVLDVDDNPHIAYYSIAGKVYYANRSFGSTAVDMDNDGFDTTVDCDDTNPNINPIAVEIPDNDIDEDCDGDTLRTVMIEVRGRVTDRNGEGVANVLVMSSDADVPSVMSGSDGRWTISNLASATTLTFEKNDNIRNGLSSQDLVLTKNHILGKIILSDNAVKAADTNGNGTLSVSDIVITTNIILGRVDAFPSNRSWLFEPAQIRLDPADAPNFIPVSGIKIGDTSGNANPSSN